MKIGIPKESAEGETRVAITPESAAKLIQSGFEVSIESNAGKLSLFPDEVYLNIGCAVMRDPSLVWTQSDAILTVKKPRIQEIEQIREEAILIGFLQPLTSPEIVKKLAEKKIISFSLDTIPRISRAQTMDALSSMSTVAGYKAVLLAADVFPKFFPMLITAAGTVTPAKVFVIGAGVAGLQAIATARRLGAVVEAFDTRPAVKEEIESLGARFVQGEWEMEPEKAQTRQGYAKELPPESFKKEEDLIFEKVRESDVVITTAQIPGKPAPKLISETMVEEMKPGSVIVDLAAETGGNCALTQPGKVVLHKGVTVMGLLNLPALMPFHASRLYSRNITNLFLYLVRDGKPKLDFSDEIVAGSCITYNGEIVHPAAKTVPSEGRL